ncbi:MAG: hypothetical protein ABI599_00005 [Flavobacteriales bacterium]
MATTISNPSNSSSRKLPAVSGVTPASATDGRGYTWSVVGESSDGTQLEFQVTGPGNGPADTTSGNSLTAAMATQIGNNTTYIQVNAAYGKGSDLNNWTVQATSSGGTAQSFKKGTGGGN